MTFPKSFWEFLSPFLKMAFLTHVIALVTLAITQGTGFAIICALILGMLVVCGDYKAFRTWIPESFFDLPSLSEVKMNYCVGMGIYGFTLLALALTKEFPVRLILTITGLRIIILVATAYLCWGFYKTDVLPWLIKELEKIRQEQIQSQLSELEVEQKFLERVTEIEALHQKQKEQTKQARQEGQRLQDVAHARQLVEKFYATHSNELNPLLSHQDLQIELLSRIPDVTSTHSAYQTATAIVKELQQLLREQRRQKAHTESEEKARHKANNRQKRELQSKLQAIEKELSALRKNQSLDLDFVQAEEEVLLKQAEKLKQQLADLEP